MNEINELVKKARILIEALPYITKFYNKTIVIKYGGASMVEDNLKRSFAIDVTLMKYIGLNPVIVHGGGPQIGELLKRLGKQSYFVRGMRVTDDETMDIVEMVLVGKINKEIVNLINQYGGKAVGLSGKDGRLIVAEKMIMEAFNESSGEKELIDIGRVGVVKEVNPDVIKALDEQRFIPVIAPVGVGDDGSTYNINADIAASKIASSLCAEKLIFLTDVEGILNEDGRLIPSIDFNTARQLIESGVIKGGMIPKVEYCLDALKSGVKKAHIIDGRIEHSILLEIFTDVGIGTQIHI